MRLILLSLMAFCFSSPAWAVEFQFADPEKAAEIVLAQDAYFDHMTAPEIAIRMGSETADKNARELKVQYADNFLEWTPEEIEQFQSVIEENWVAIEEVEHLLPDTIWFIRANDKVEGGLPHTQGNAIVIQTPVKELSAFLMFHEMFHVLSRHNADKQPEIYGLLGFHSCQWKEPDDLWSKHLTNPDVPFEGYYLPVDIAGQPGNVIPFLYAAYPAFNPEVEGGFGGHFGFGLLSVEVRNGVCTSNTDEEGNSELLSLGEVPGYLEALGGNTGYIIHPEETLADNFGFFLLEKADLKTPEVPELLGTWIDAQK